MNILHIIVLITTNTASEINIIFRDLFTRCSKLLNLVLLSLFLFSLAYQIVLQ